MKANRVPFLLVFFALSASSAVFGVSPVHADGLVVIDCPPIVVPPGTPVPLPRPMPPIEFAPTVIAPPFITPPPPRTLPPPRPPLPPQPVPWCPAYLSVKNHNVTVTIENQIARTHVDETFVNDSAYQLEGTYIFPLPDDAAISQFAMWVDGKKVEGQVLDRNQAHQIYEEIVRRQRDPALLEYIGRNAFQARIFPIPPHADKRVEIEYSQVLKVEQGLVRYIYPLNTEKFSAKPLANVSINISIRSNAALKAIYSPSHQVSVARDGDYRARVGYEDSNVKPDRDFLLYYSISQQDIGLNLLTYKPVLSGANGLGSEDGFFLLLVAPKVEVSAARVVAKDVILVLDVSGSMRGLKIDQAKRALNYVLDQLNSGDRFNVIAFSTGTSAYASALQPASARGDAKGFVGRLRAEGSTDINRALLEAMGYADRERPTLIIFLTDGLPTTGETNSQKIIANATNSASRNVRLFTFGVGDDVNTIMLDSLAERLRGASGYVRPNEKIDEVVSAFYAKVSTPVLSDITIDWSSEPAFLAGGGIVVSDVYPYPLPDLFAGTQLVVAGRYRNAGATTIVLKGSVNGAPQSFQYFDVTFRSSGGDDSIPRLWATRKIGYLLNQIRLSGESKEVVNEIVTLAVRYGIVTPYTSFLVDEGKDVFTPQGRTDAAQDLSKSFAPSTMPTSGAAAVQQSQQQNQLRRAETAPTTSAAQIKSAGDKTFILRSHVWTDTQFDPSRMTTKKIAFGSDAYFALLDPKGLGNLSGLGRYLALGSRVIVVLNDVAYEITDDGSGATQSSPAAPSMIGEAGTGGVGGEVTPGSESQLLPVSIQTPIAALSRAQDNASQIALLVGVVMLGIGMVVSVGVGAFVVLRRR